MLEFEDEYSAETRFGPSTGTFGKVVLEKAYGLTDRDQQVKNVVETKFRIGSMNKMFTATAALQLGGEGKIDLSTLSKYLPDYPNHQTDTEITIRL